MKLQEILCKARVFIIRTAQEPSSVIVDTRIGNRVLRGCVELESFSDFPLLVRTVCSHQYRRLRNVIGIFLIPLVQFLKISADLSGFF